MNKTTLALYNKVRRDTLVKLADNIVTLSDYLARYYQASVTDADVSALYKALQTSNAKRVKPVHVTVNTSELVNIG